MPAKFTLGGAHKQADKSYAAALIDDDTPTPTHVQFRWPGLIKILLAGAVLWCVPMTILPLQIRDMHGYRRSDCIGTL